MLRVAEALDPPSSRPRDGEVGWCTLDRFVEDAASLITRFEPPEALSASATDGLIIDIRSQDARELHGVVPGSLHIPRTVLEWRIAMDSPWRNRHLAGLDQRLILICDHGYSSILAASNLVQLGFHRAADVIGGFEAWHQHGLPIARRPRRPSSTDALPGTGPPE
jgi:rhodanese-related sulfurtransferase